MPGDRTMGERRADPERLDRGALHAALVTHRSTLEDIKQGRTAKGTDYAVERAITAYLDALRREGLLGAGREEWTCPHGVTYTGTADFIGGARNAHDEFDGCRSGRSMNDIAQDIIDLCPEAERFCNEWVESYNARLNACAKLAVTTLTPEEAEALGSIIIEWPPDCTCDAALLHKDDCALGRYQRLVRSGRAKLRSLSGRQGAGT